ncbi:hypothetical protein HK101_008893 [Irineochytrium annulatum]|nr:hypothetical protein HK101_008893 [Irineochytrium annulatum]
MPVGPAGFPRLRDWAGGGYLYNLSAIVASSLPPSVPVLNDDPLLTALVAVVVALLTIVAVGILVSSVVSRGSRKKGSIVLITGLADSGKTALYMKVCNALTEEKLWLIDVIKLRYGKMVETQSSMEENDATFPVHNRWLRMAGVTSASTSPSPPKSIHLVDLPGHDKVRYRLYDLLPQTARVVFLLDSSTFQRHRVRPAAELLADILGSSSVVRDGTPVLVVCNKADGLLAVDKARVKQGLESEIDRIRATRSAGLESQDATGGGPTSNAGDWEYIGLEGQPFTFDQLTGEIEFVETSVKIVGDGEEEDDEDGEEKDEAEEPDQLADGFKRVVQFIYGV